MKGLGPNSLRRLSTVSIGLVLCSSLIFFGCKQEEYKTQVYGDFAATFDSIVLYGSGDRAYLLGWRDKKPFMCLPTEEGSTAWAEVRVLRNVPYVIVGGTAFETPCAIIVESPEGEAVRLRRPRVMDEAPRRTM